MLTVEADADRVEERLRSDGLFCPFCAGVLTGWGFARPRRLRDVEGPIMVRPRRTVCTGCRRTQVLLPVIGLSRRADVVEVIGAALVAKAAGWGHRLIAVLVGRPGCSIARSARSPPTSSGPGRNGCDGCSGGHPRWNGKLGRTTRQNS